MQKVICIHPDDDMLVALVDLTAGEVVNWEAESILIPAPVKAKHKIARHAAAEGEVLRMYGVAVGKAMATIRRGEAITTENLQHYAADVELEDSAPYQWTPPDVSRLKDGHFMGVVRADGRVGTANHWLVFPLVFCENRNVEHLRKALEAPLGYAANDLASYTLSLLGQDMEAPKPVLRPFPNVDGVRIITHAGGCGGTRADARSLCRILASYADHPNVAGVTVFSLGCQNAQIAMFKEELAKVNPDFAKPMLIYEQQQWGSEDAMMKAVVADTLAQLKEANKVARQPVPLSHLKIGVKCGGSDGFSGISANPAMGLVSDMVVALGGSSILAEFPELCGVESSLLERCENDDDKRRFIGLMRDFEARAEAVGTHFADNPSPGNIRDGLITDAMKSAGAAKKGGSSPIVSVLDYGEQTGKHGLSLLCTPGGDVESVTGIVASGANVVLFSTGLGTPTGNPIVPVLKIASNSRVATKMNDVIDYDCGPVIEGRPLPDVADGLLDMVIDTASGTYQAKADRLQQYDFIFWKRDISL
ncbi:UxaA family hydrolase [Noviherbaspirillum pedocola]|uniref:Altronate dehydratase n=1 Tax=Noviherbaspirillum pedocola TaxID=2801341 RepID=A0A934SX61_9BURK|nr:altronate dehydratase family protein [Noviherbaspirillum pedocola]MBK4734339.1 altronate dehydratase [Noviherbaspirillum pedocola]